MTQFIRFIRCTLTALLAAAIPVSLHAQTSGFSPADEKELASYRLTMDTVNKLETATLAMIEEMKKDPRYQKLAKIQAEMEALEKKEEPTDADIERMQALEEEKEALESAVDLNLTAAGSLDAMEASVKKTPILARSVEQAGLTPRSHSSPRRISRRASMRRR